MSLKIGQLRSEASSRTQFVAARTLYLDAEDNVLTPDDDPTLRRRVLVREGSGIPMAVAELYGLATETPASVAGDVDAAPVPEPPTGFSVNTTAPDVAEPEPPPERPPVGPRMSRADLDAVAIAEGIDNPEAMENKGAVLAAIEEGRS